MTTVAPQDDFKPLTGLTLILAGLVVGLTNFMVLLDTIVANVSVGNIAGALGNSSTQALGLLPPIPSRRPSAYR